MRVSGGKDPVSLGIPDHSGALASCRAGVLGRGRLVAVSRVGFLFDDACGGDLETALAMVGRPLSRSVICGVAI